MKILLDIDGVMIPARPWQTYQTSADGFGEFSKTAIESLNRIITACDNPVIILTTSHKHSFELSHWENIFKNRGIVFTKVDRLQSDSLTHSRFEEITQWVLKNQNEDFIILDDDKGLNNLSATIKEDHLILTKATVGLNLDDEAAAILKISQQQHSLKN